MLSWHDAIIASQDDILGNSDDVVLAEFAHDVALAVGDHYDRSEAIVLPGDLSQRYTLFVRTDAQSAVFENGPFDLLPLAGYARC
ncbi:hypothetical protein ACC771_15800, partial [Rhizobium ruizarguesonis]